MSLLFDKDAQRALMRREKERTDALAAELARETSELTASLASALCLPNQDVPVVALRVLAKLVLVGALARGDIAELRDVRRF